MLTIKMDDQSLHTFSDREYTDYEITKNFVVVKNEERWVGIFDRRHFVSLVVVANEK